MGTFFSFMFSPRNHQDLHNAVQRADVKAIRHLVKHGYDVNSIDIFGFTPLQLAIGYKTTCSTNCVINTLSTESLPYEKGEAKTHSFKSKVSYLRSDLIIVKTLLELGANPNQCSVGKVRLKPPLFHAIDASKPELVHILLHNGADVKIPYMGQDALEYTFRKPTPDGMLQRQFLKIKEQILMQLLGHCDLAAVSEDYPQVILCHAVWTGSTKIVSTLLDKMSVEDINTPTRSGNLAICSAIANGQADIMCLLTEKGADLRHISKTTINPLAVLVGNETVAAWDKLKIIHEFIDRGGDVEACNFSERLTELALVGRHTDLLQKMADSGVYLSTGPPKQTALRFILKHRSCNSKHSPGKKLKLVQILIKSGGNILEYNKNREPIMHDILHLLESINHANKDAMVGELRTYIENTTDLDMNLQHMCRNNIRLTMGRKCTKVNIAILPLPKTLQDFLLFSDCPVTQWQL